MRGSIGEATAGTLQIYVGAHDDDFAAVAPVLQSLGDVRHVGPPGAGASMKLVVNTMLIASAALLGGSPVGPTVAATRDKGAAGHYPLAFALGLADKDIHLVVDVASGSTSSWPRGPGRGWT